MESALRPQYIVNVSEMLTSNFLELAQPLPIYKHNRNTTV